MHSLLTPTSHQRASVYLVQMVAADYLPLQLAAARALLRAQRMSAHSHPSHFVLPHLSPLI